MRKGWERILPCSKDVLVVLHVIDEGREGGHHHLVLVVGEEHLGVHDGEAMETAAALAVHGATKNGAAAWHHCLSPPPASLPPHPFLIRERGCETGERE